MEFKVNAIMEESLSIEILPSDSGLSTSSQDHGVDVGSNQSCSPQQSNFFASHPRGAIQHIGHWHSPGEKISLLKEASDEILDSKRTLKACLPKEDLPVERLSVPTNHLKEDSLPKEIPDAISDTKCISNAIDSIKDLPVQRYPILKTKLPDDDDSKGEPVENVSKVQRCLILKTKPAQSQTLQLDRRKITINNFELLTIIGKGSFGEVRICREKITRKLYAMKKQSKADMIKNDLVYYAEAQQHIVAELDNHFIVKLFCSFQDEENLYLVMEYVHGGKFECIDKCLFLVC